ncbi:molybdopterin molybdochelatase [Sphingobium faniae]|nr:molybdopterin molybdochelatase [Sphingobium faniae]
MSLLPVSEAQARLFALAQPLAVEEVSAAFCAGRWLAEDRAARRDQPWADLSAMDGYAVRAAEWPGPWRVTGISSAGGDLPAPLAQGAACRIFTGAPLPDGADAILIQENAERNGDSLRGVDKPVTPRLHVRAAASDFHAGEALLAAGSPLNAAKVALAVLAGYATLPVRKRPAIAILSTGNELVAPGEPVPPGRLPSSNAPMLAALLAILPCDIVDLGIVPDDLDAMTGAFVKAGKADVIISTGGASVGDHDLVRPAFTAAGGTLDFWKIRMRPGKPLMAGKLGPSVFLGLPGNPVSAFVTAMLFLLPLVRHMGGAACPLPATTDARLAAPLPRTGDRDDYLRAFQAEEGIVSVTSQDSAAAAAMARADCLIWRPAHSQAAEAGDFVKILPFPR